MRLQVGDAEEKARAAEEAAAANEREAAALEARRAALEQGEAAAAAEAERLAAAAAAATAVSTELDRRGARVADAEARVQVGPPCFPQASLACIGLHAERLAFC